MKGPGIFSAYIPTSRQFLQIKIEEIAKTQAHHLETMTCAFISEVGSEAASRHTLVQETETAEDGSMMVRWYFLRSPAENTP